MKNLRNILPILLFFAFFSLNAAQNEGFRVLHNAQTGKPAAYSALQGDTRPVLLPRQYREKSREMRGIWIVTYANLDFRKTDMPAEFKQKYLSALVIAKRAGFNAVFFQIRPACDAFYNSSIVPFSRAIRGKEGYGYTNLDMLQFMIQTAHSQGMQFHAWLNPYRVAGATGLSKQQYLNTLSPKNFARLHPECVMAVPSGKSNQLILDPGAPLVRTHLHQVVREIITKYNPDSIVFDDYFYPYNYQGNADFATYRKWNRSPNMTLAQWRRNNVNLMVRDISMLIRSNNTAQKKRIRFGISPFGIWLNRKSSPSGSPTLGLESYHSNFSDTHLWIRQRWIDYVIPQLYWTLDHAKAPYACLADWWADLAGKCGVKLYIGIGAHQRFDQYHTDELKNQILYNQRRNEISGSVFYSWRRVFLPETKTQRQAAANVIRGCWGKTLP